MKTGIELIAQERQEQIEKHGYTVSDDVSVNEQGQLPLAAIMLIEGGLKNRECLPYDWSENQWKKMFDKPYKERLIIAGALIAAELDRLTDNDY